MQTLQKSALQTELEASAIALDLSLNFTNIMGGTAWEYLFYTDSQELRTNTGTLRKKWLKAYAHIDNGGWWCGTLDILTGERSPWGCFKPKNPRINDDGKPIKYEHPPTVPTEPFFLELNRDRWERVANMHGLGFPDLSEMPPSADPFEFWEWVKQNPKLPIIITEGAKKTASLLSASYCAVGLSGIWNGAPKELAGDGTPLEKKLNPQLQAIATEGREIIFCFDNDTKPKTIAAVTKATETLAALFEAEGCKTSVMYWRNLYEEKGIDDVHAVHGRDALDKLFGDRLPLDQWLDLMSKPILTDPTKAPKVEALTSTPLQPVSTYDPALEPEEEIEAEEEKAPALTYQEIALQTVFSDGHYISIQNSPSDWVLYKFNGKYYEPTKPSHIRKMIKAWAEQYWVKDPKTGRKRLKYLTTSCINEIFKYALLTFEVEREDCNPEGHNLDNGILRIHWKGNTPTWRLHPHTPKAHFLYCSSVRYDPNADPKYCDRLLECLEPLPREILLRNLSAMFGVQKIRALQGRVLRAGLCVGRGANGKDSLRNILGHIFNEHMVSIALSDFVAYDKGDKKALKELAHAKLNWSSENNQETPLDKIEILNALISGEQNVLWIEDKYVSARRQKEAESIHLFNCNNLPIIKSGLKSLESRFVIYNFDKTFVPDPDPSKGELKADPRFHDDFQFQIEHVAPALLNRLLTAFVDLAREGIDYSHISKGLKTLQEASTHLWTFTQDVGLVEDKNGRVWISDLWESLEQWYIDNGTLEKTELYDGTFKKTWNEQPIRFDPNVTSMNQVFKRFQKLFPNISNQKETRDPANKNKAFIQGLSFKSASLPHYPDTASIHGSPSASPSLTNYNPASPSLTNTYSPSLPSGEAKSEGRGEAETLVSKQGEPVSQNSAKPFSSENQKNKKNETEEFSVGDRLIDSRTGEELIVLEEPGIGIRAIRQEYTCQRANIWMAIAHLTRQGGGKDDPVEVGCVAKSQDGELVDVKAISEDGLWAWCERNEILVPQRFLRKA